MILDSSMVQKREFNQFAKQKILSIQKHKCNERGLKFNVSNLPEFGHSQKSKINKDGIQALCTSCFSNSKS